MPSRAEDVADPVALRFSGRLAIEKLTKTKDRIQRRPQFVTHPGKEIALGVVRAVSLFFRLAQRFLNPRAVRYVVGDAENDLVLLGPGRGPKNIDNASVLAQVTIDEIGELAGLHQAFARLRGLELVFGMNERAVRAADQLAWFVTPELFAGGIESDE